MADERSSPPVLDTWLAGLSHDLPDGEIAGYVALGSASGTSPSGFAIVKLPHGVGPGAVGQHMEAERLSVSERIARAMKAHAQYSRDLERTLSEKSDYVDELVLERERAEAREAAMQLANQQLTTKLTRLENEMRSLRTRTAVAEGEAMRACRERDDAVSQLVAAGLREPPADPAETGSPE